MNDIQSTAVTPMVFFLIFVAGAIGTPLLIVYNQV